MTEATTNDRYDSVTIGLHWLTALIVIGLFGSSLLWRYAPRSWGLRWLEDWHVSVGIALAAVLIARLIWRLVAGRRLKASGGMVTDLLARIVHWTLYVLLTAQVALGFTLRWFEGEDFSFFGLFDIPQLIASNRGLEHTVQNLHNLTAWALICLAGGHAIMALVHRYVFKDGVLKRMLPIAG